jgi:hypothetical protein
MRARWKQVRRAGEVGLHPFTAAELGAVTLDTEAVPEAERGPFLQVVTPLLAAPGAPPVALPGRALPDWAVPVDDATPAASAAAVTRLEGLGSSAQATRRPRPGRRARDWQAGRQAPAANPAPGNR